MQVWKKFSAVALALVMSLALCAPAFAADPDSSTSTTLTNGEAGGYTTPDTPNLNTKVVYLDKEITAYNPDKTIIYGPEITYTYTVTPAATTELQNITDDGTNDHENGVPVTQKAQAGVTTGVKVNDNTTAGGASSAIGTLEWTNADILTASTNGTKNTKAIKFDFSAVVFETPGIYRYKITESVDESQKNYTTSGVEDKSQNIRYLDVYVMRSNAYKPIGTVVDEVTKTAYVAGDWTIYGYVCTSDVSSAITPSSNTKTNGFINNVSSGDSNADQYRTYNLTVKKTLLQDPSMVNHQFPFTVAFDAGTKTGNFQLIAETNNTSTSTKVGVTTTSVETGTALAPASTAITSTNAILKIGSSEPLSSFATTVANLKIADQGEITFIGIPNGTKVTVTEENDVTGTTYSTSATQKVGGGTAAAVTFESDSNGTRSSDYKSISIDKDGTAIYKQSDATADDTNVEIVFTNLLSLISPTGVTLRYAPYLAMMGAGIVALPLSLRKKKEEEI